MYSTSMPPSTTMNGMGGSMIDGSGTINPAALNTPEARPSQSSLHAHASPRGQKRSRSPEYDADVVLGGDAEDDDQKRKKRGRAPVSKSDESPTSTSAVQVTRNSPEQHRTPAPPAAILPQETKPSPSQTSPPKSATKQVVKALPTVRDHTTDQLTPEGDEYVPREYDEQGEQKVAPTGHPQQGREFKMRTFYVPNRGEKLFMLATECARILSYRDSYLLFNKNRSLHKIIATQAEKDELIKQEILPYSYRSRQIAIVTAKSMFRQFGARVINDGRRVRDDYWEAKAKKQGFTEDDLAGEKRPGASKARDAAAVQAANDSPEGLGLGLARPDIRYVDVGMPGPQSAASSVPIPMIQTEVRDLGNIPRSRQDVTGLPYQDKTQPSLANDVLHQASNAAELNKSITQQRTSRAKIYEDTWNRKRDIPPPLPIPQQKSEATPPISQSPQLPSNAIMNTPQQPMLHHQPSTMMSPSGYSHPNPIRHSSHTQSPVRQPIPSAMRPDLHPQQRSSYNPVHHASQPSPYGYPHPQPNQIWGQPPPHPQPQPQQSPLAAHYSPSPHPTQLPLQPPLQPQQQQHHPSQSPHPQPPQLHHSQSSGSMHSNMPYQSLAGSNMPSGPTYGGGSMDGHHMYNQHPQQHSGSPTPQGYMQQTTAAQQGGMPGWVPPQTPPQPQPGGWGGYPNTTGY